MSDNFIFSLLEFPDPNRTADSPDPQPNWEGAREYVLEMSDLALAKSINDAKEYDCNSKQVDEENFIWEVCTHFSATETVDVSETLDAMRGEILYSIDECEKMWNGEGQGKSIYLNASMVLVCGGCSETAPVESLEAMEIFEASGSADVAGFINVLPKRF
jgi:hypothetical protein